MGNYFYKNQNGYWKYKSKEGYDLNFKETSRDYDYGENQNGDPYYIKYDKSGWNKNTKAFNLYPIEDDLYQDNEGNVLPVEWGKYYDPNSTWLPNLEVTPRTGTLILDTYFPLSKEYPFTGHSALQIEPDAEISNDYRFVSKDSSDDDYNLITNNCADDTRRVLETLFNKKMNNFLFTTPGDSRDFLLENGGTRMKDGSVHFKLSEEQLIKLRNFIDNMYKNKRRLND